MGSPDVIDDGHDGGLPAQVGLVLLLVLLSVGIVSAEVLGAQSFKILAIGGGVGCAWSAGAPWGEDGLPLGLGGGHEVEVEDGGHVVEHGPTVRGRAEAHGSVGVVHHPLSAGKEGRGRERGGREGVRQWGGTGRGRPWLPGGWGGLPPPSRRR